jgi:hypothetical protein
MTIMAWWSLINSTLSAGQVLRTPGRGIPPTRQGTFKIYAINAAEIIIESGQGQIILEKVCFDIVEQAFISNPAIRLRVASLHDNLPLPGSVDKLIRDATGSNLARGNYVSSILAYCNIVKYAMNGRQKVVVL